GDRHARRTDRLRYPDRGPTGAIVKLARMTVLAALQALGRHRARSALTALGVVIGVAAVIAMVSVGQGADASVEAQLASLGPNIVMIFPGATTAGGVRSGWGGASTLTVGDGRAIEKECPSVAGVTWVKRDIAQVTYGNQNWSTAIQGSPPSYTLVRDWPLASGRFSTAERRVIGSAFLGTVNLIMVSAPSPAEAIAAEQEMRRLLHDRHRTPPGQDDDFTVRNMAELFEASLMASRVMTKLLATIA